MSLRLMAPVVVVVKAAFPEPLYIEISVKGFISTVSCPLGIPVIFRTRVAVLLPAVWVTLLIEAPVAVPVPCIKVRVKSAATKAPVPLLFVYTPSLKVMVTELSEFTTPV
ncbi:hypothetical protein ES703_107227 [subsurface metagenome]